MYLQLKLNPREASDALIFLSEKRNGASEMEHYPCATSLLFRPKSHIAKKDERTHGRAKYIQIKDFEFIILKPLRKDRIKPICLRISNEGE